jgi:hypothetical protein
LVAIKKTKQKKRQGCTLRQSFSFKRRIGFLQRRAIDDIDGRIRMIRCTTRELNKETNPMKKEKEKLNERRNNVCDNNINLLNIQPALPVSSRQAVETDQSAAP